MTLRIGQIDYANCTPIFAALQNNCDCAGYRFIRGVPAQLNGMLRRGEIDVSPSSSFEYGKFPGKYLLLPEMSISSDGPVKSVLLFSRVPIEELNNQAIALTTESDTSVNLLRIILARQYGFSNTFQRTTLPLREAIEKQRALLLIGDAALRESMANRDLFVYDLGELWLGFTGLPFVFALWIVTREAVSRNRGEVQSLAAGLIAAKRRAYESFESIADTCKEREWLGREALIDYWQTLSYDLTPRHLQGVATFFRYARELQLIREEPEIRLFA